MASVVGVKQVHDLVSIGRIVPIIGELHELSSQGMRVNDLDVLRRFFRRERNVLNRYTRDDALRLDRINANGGRCIAFDGDVTVGRFKRILDDPHVLKWHEVAVGVEQGSIGSVKVETQLGLSAPRFVVEGEIPGALLALAHVELEIGAVR